jgi:hypothetical protein
MNTPVATGSERPSGGASVLRSGVGGSVRWELKRKGPRVASSIRTKSPLGLGLSFRGPYDLGREERNPYYEHCTFTA